MAGLLTPRTLLGEEMTALGPNTVQPYQATSVPGSMAFW